jgi:Arc/MetJ-type ribon-helix-helix transcriptional regulator
MYYHVTKGFTMKQQVSISLTAKQIQKIDSLAEGKYMSRSQLIRTLLLDALDRIDDRSSLDYRILKLEESLRQLTYERSKREDHA